MSGNSGALQAYETTPADPVADRESILAAWRQGLAHHGRAEAKLAWYYIANPAGAPRVLFLRHAQSASPVGVAAAGGREIRLGERRLRAGAMVDFAVDPAHRVLFPAMLLQKAMCRAALEDHDLLFGMPNASSEAAVKRVGYKRVGDLVRRVQVLRSRAYLAQRMPAALAALAAPLLDRARRAVMAFERLSAPGFVTAWRDVPDARFDELWARAAPPDLAIGVRDRAFLAWRFAECPMQRSRFFTVAARDGRLAAYAACEQQDAVLYVQDFLVDPGIPGAWRRLWSELAREAWRQGCTSLAVGFLGPEAVHRRLAATGFVARGRRPFYAVLPDEFAGLASERRWYVTPADQDGS